MTTTRPDASGQLAAQAVHDLRSPLHAILGSTELLLSGGGLDDGQRRHLRVISTEAQSMVGLVDALLDVSRIRADRFETVLEPFGPSLLLDSVAAALGVSARRKGLDLSVDIGSEVPRAVLGDQQRVRRILTNLGSNAVKYTDAGRVGLRVSGLEGNWLRFEVVDTGRGIPASVADRLFRPFEQVERRDQSTGTGLGLSLVRELVEELGGRLDYRSDTNGSTFSFDLELRPARRAADHAEIERIEGGTGRVLIVDDSEINRSLAAAQLERLGYASDEVTTAEEALELLAVRQSGEAPFDAVLMDWRLPGIDGLEAIRRWRAVEDEQTVDLPLPIVSVTANALSGDRQACLEAGASDFLAKPVSLDDLGRMLKRLVPDGQLVASEEPEAPPAVDRSRVQALATELGADAVQAVVGAFVDALGTARGAVLEAWDTDDLETVGRNAHTIRPNAEMLGADQLAEACRTLEHAAGDGSADRASVDRFVEAVEAALEGFRLDGHA